MTLDTICPPLPQSHEFKHCLIISLSRKYVSHAYSNALSMSLSNLLASPWNFLGSADFSFMSGSRWDFIWIEWKNGREGSIRASFGNSFPRPSPGWRASIGVGACVCVCVCVWISLYRRHKGIVRRGKKEVLEKSNQILNGDIAGPSVFIVIRSSGSSVSGSGGCQSLVWLLAIQKCMCCCRWARRSSRWKL